MSVEKIIGDWKKKLFKPIYWFEGEEDYYIDLLMNDFITIQDFAGATHIIFTKYITNLTLQNGTAKIHINSGGSSMTVHTKYTMKELMEIILN